MQKAAPPPLEYVGEWGIKGDGPGQLSRPEWLTTDSSGNVFVADSGSGFIHKFDPKGGPLLSFHEGVPSKPSGVAVDRGGGIYVIAPLVNAVFIFTPEGERFRTLHLRPALRHQWPDHVAVDDDGNIYVIEVMGDSGAREIRKYTSRGRLLKSWKLAPDSAGVVLTPEAIGFGADRAVYIVDFTGRQIEKFTREGSLVTTWGKMTSGRDELDRAWSGCGIGVTEKYVLVTDSENRGVRAWTLAGEERLADDLGARLGASSGKFQIAVSPRGELLVLDDAGARVLRFRINF